MRRYLTLYTPMLEPVYSRTIKAVDKTTVQYLTDKFNCFGIISNYKKPLDRKSDDVLVKYTRDEVLEKWAA